MRLLATELTWCPRHPIINEETGEIAGYKHGKVFAGQDIEWRDPLEEAPPSLIAPPEGHKHYVKGNAEKLQAARDAAAARRRLRERDQRKALMRRDLEAELREEARAGAKEDLRAELAADLKAAEKVPPPPKPKPKKPANDPYRARQTPYATPPAIVPAAPPPETAVTQVPQKA